MSLIKVKNAKIYLGGNDLVGLAKEITLPEIKQKFSDSSGLGMIGVVELPDGQIEKLEAKIVWNTIYKSLFNHTGDPNKTLNLQIRATMAEYSSGQCVTSDVVYSLATRAKNLNLGGVKTGESLEGVETELAVDAAKVYIDNKPYLEVDIFSNTYKIEGKDVAL